jgi:hypothetical protein
MPRIWLETKYNFKEENMLKELKLHEIKEVKGGKGAQGGHILRDCDCNCGTVAKSQASDMATFANG